MKGGSLALAAAEIITVSKWTGWFSLAEYEPRLQPGFWVLFHLFTPHLQAHNTGLFDSIQDGTITLHIQFLFAILAENQMSKRLCRSRSRSRSSAGGVGSRAVVVKPGAERCSSCSSSSREQGWSCCSECNLACKSIKGAKPTHHIYSVLFQLFTAF